MEDNGGLNVRMKDTEPNDNGLLNRYLSAYSLEEALTEPMRAHLMLFSYKPGERIYNQGGPLENIYILVKGKIKIYTTSEEGKSLILSFKGPLEVIGDIEFVQGIDIINTVEAVSPVQMIGIHHRWLTKYGKDHPPLLQFLLHIITRKFHFKSSSLSFNLMYPVEVRLASYLLSMSYDEADMEFVGQLSTIHLKDAANLLGTSYRHLNRVIQRFCAEGLVERRKGAIVVKNKTGLQALAGTKGYE